MVGSITWDTDINAPCCPGQIVSDDGRTRLVQTDWDYPGVASSFGWSLHDIQPDCVSCEELFEDCNCEDKPEPCDHDSTDGTVDCESCGLTASHFIGKAGEWLEENDGATAADPGYFD